MYIYLYFKFLIAFLSLHNIEKWYLSFMYTMYTNALNNTPSYTHTSSYGV